MPEEKSLERLIYRSFHCGLRELDLILGPFAEKEAALLSDKERAAFETLLTQNGLDLLNWITDAAPVPKEFQTAVMDKIKTNVKL